MKLFNQSINQLTTQYLLNGYHASGTPPERGHTAGALTTIYLIPPLTTLHSQNEQDSEYIKK